LTRLARKAYRERMDPMRRRIFAARALAVVADAVQIALVPIFAEGAASVVNDVLDVVVGLTLVILVGWHWVFLPAFVAELVPVIDLAPTWTIAVLIATRGRHEPAPSPSPRGGPSLPPGTSGAS
jgi:hypothetical protein